MDPSRWCDPFATRVAIHAVYCDKESHPLRLCTPERIGFLFHTWNVTSKQFMIHKARTSALSSVHPDEPPENRHNRVRVTFPTFLPTRSQPFSSQESDPTHTTSSVASTTSFAFPFKPRSKREHISFSNIEASFQRISFLFSFHATPLFFFCCCCCCSYKSKALHHVRQTRRKAFDVVLSSTSAQKELAFGLVEARMRSNGKHSVSREQNEKHKKKLESLLQKEENRCVQRSERRRRAPLPSRSVAFWFGRKKRFSCFE